MLWPAPALSAAGWYLWPHPYGGRRVFNPSGGPGSVLHRADEVVRQHPWWAFTAAYLLLAALLIGVNLDTVPLRRFDGAFTPPRRGRSTGATGASPSTSCRYNC